MLWRVNKTMNTEWFGPRVWGWVAQDREERRAVMRPHCCDLITFGCLLTDFKFHTIFLPNFIYSPGKSSKMFYVHSIFESNYPWCCRCTQARIIRHRPAPSRDPLNSDGFSIYLWIRRVILKRLFKNNECISPMHLLLFL